MNFSFGCVMLSFLHKQNRPLNKKLFGGLAVYQPAMHQCDRPITLRPRLATGLPFPVYIATLR